MKKVSKLKRMEILRGVKSVRASDFAMAMVNAVKVKQPENINLFDFNFSLLPNTGKVQCGDDAYLTLNGEMVYYPQTKLPYSPAEIDLRTQIFNREAEVVGMYNVPVYTGDQLDFYLSPIYRHDGHAYIQYGTDQQHGFYRFEPVAVRENAFGELMSAHDGILCADATREKSKVDFHYAQFKQRLEHDFTVSQRLNGLIEAPVPTLTNEQGQERA